ncbi:MAG: hypothetical protein HY900_23595 [Deltaproteobacteria bacterium]|nr:hypothetical protein [Deltaproteobacteria bacterium]
MWSLSGIRGCRLMLAAMASGALQVGLAVPAVSGPYLDSAHGDAAMGVNRSTLDARYQNYATGNCAHCHEMHASLDGSDPAPAGGPAPDTVFFRHFNTARTLHPYVETDDFCFHCHSETLGQRVINQAYSATFGGGVSGTGPQSIMTAFNQATYHNLYDVWRFLQTNQATYPWFKNSSNPCSACHNPHLAKRSMDAAKPGYPLRSVLSKPGSHTSLWGETQVMSSYASYEAPYAFGTGREPGGVGDPDGTKTPDYVGFCTVCHNTANTIWSTTLNRNLKKVNWAATGEQRDKHGSLARDGSSYFREPYNTAAAVKVNFVLSCLDCHEAHGAPNIMLLRRRMNAEDLDGPVTMPDLMGYACKRCHKDDLAAGTGVANRWEYVHHDAPGAPYAKGTCTGCHATSSEPIACGNCHGHGMDDTWAGVNKTGRTTF